MCWLDHIIDRTNPLRPLHSVDVIELARYFLHLFGPYHCADLVQLDLKSGLLGLVCLHELLLHHLHAWIGLCPGIDFASEDDRSGRDSAIGADLSTACSPCWWSTSRWQPSALLALAVPPLAPVS